MTVRNDALVRQLDTPGVPNDQRKNIEAALAAWRDAERRLVGANGDTEAVRAEIVRHRTEFQRLTTEHMISQMDALHHAEARRSTAVPSTEPFHEAAQDEKAIAADIWENARESDEDTPQTRFTKPPTS